MRASLVIVVFLAVVGLVHTLRAGYVPARYLPLSPLDLDEPGFLVVNDWKLSALRRDREACLRALDQSSVEFEVVTDQPIDNGCGWQNAVRITEIDGATMAPVTLTCPAAAALVMWVIHEVQPTARKHLQQQVSRIAHFGSYACRDIRSGAGLGLSRRSEHATADAIDISGFQLEGGETVTVLRHWSNPGDRSGFLRAIHRSSCRYFRVSLGPGANALHENHFHLDRGWLWSCR